MITNKPNPKLLAVLISLALFTQADTARADDYFDPAFLTMSGIPVETLDLSAFAKSGKVPPGTYLVNVYVNRNEIGQHSINFVADAGGKVEPQITPDLLNKLGVNVHGLAALHDLPADQPIESLPRLIEHARVSFNFSKLQLDLSIPQIAMQPNAIGVMDPSKWDHGIPALLLNYNLSGGQNWQTYGESNNLFVGLNGGVNIDAWRLRSSMYWSRNSQKSSGRTSSNERMDFSNTYLMRDIAALNAGVVLGESNTDNEVLDSIPFRGVMLSSTDEMLPAIMRGFAPVIEGIAQSNARVTVSQNGNVVYQTYVAPGPFRFEDIGQTGSAGDLILQINEADGTVHTQIIPVSSVPVMRRAGSLKYELVAGRYNGGITTDSRKAEFVQGTAIYGLPHDITVYGGTLLARDYVSAVAGTGISLGKMGAISADVTTSRAKITGLDAPQTGESYRVRYAKSLLSTGTTVDLAAYRYSTRNYYSFTDYNGTGYQLNDDAAPWTFSRQRSAFQLRLSQQLGDWGTTYLSATRTDYWGKNDVMNAVSAGYNTSFKGVGYGLAYTIDRAKGQGDWKENRMLSFNMTVPLSLFSPKYAGGAYASYQASHSQSGQVQQMAGIAGNALDSNLSYSAMQGWSNGSQGDNTNLNAGYNGSKGNISGGYSHSSNSRSLNLSGNGGLVVHSGGVTFGKTLGSSVAIVSAPEASGAGVGYGGVTTDSRGYALVPYLSTYQSNNISLNPATLPDNVDLAHNNVAVYPTKGAVVMAKFATKIGYQALITLAHHDTVIPFGTTATLLNTESDEPNTGIVGDGGQLYMSGLPEKGKIKLKWGNQRAQHCNVAYNLKKVAPPSANNPIRALAAQCK